MSAGAADDSAAAPAAADAEPSAPRAPATAHVLAQAVLDFEEGDAQVRFDEAARRLVLIKHKEFVAMPLAAPAGDARGRSEAQQVIRCENRGKVENVRFSLNHRFVAVQRSDVELELLDLLLGNAFTHLCKGGGSKQRWRILNFQWTGTPVADFLVVTTAGIELYLVLPDKKALKLVKRVEHAVAWCVYSHPTRLVMLATGAHDNIMHGLQVQPQAIVRIPKFEVQLAPPLDASGASAAAELGQQKASRSLLPSQLHVVRLYNAIYCVHVEPERRQLLLYQLFKDFVVRKCAARNSPRAILSAQFSRRNSPRNSRRNSRRNSLTRAIPHQVRAQPLRDERRGVGVGQPAPRPLARGEGGADLRPQDQHAVPDLGAAAARDAAAQPLACRVHAALGARRARCGDRPADGGGGYPQA